jgi:hypothetical protein
MTVDANGASRAARRPDGRLTVTDSATASVGDREEKTAIAGHAGPVQAVADCGSVAALAFDARSAIRSAIAWPDLTQSPIDTPPR